MPVHPAYYQTSSQTCLNLKDSASLSADRRPNPLQPSRTIVIRRCLNTVPKLNAPAKDPNRPQTSKNRPRPQRLTTLSPSLSLNRTLKSLYVDPAPRLNVQITSPNPSPTSARFFAPPNARPPSQSQSHAHSFSPRSCRRDPSPIARRDPHLQPPPRRHLRPRALLGGSVVHSPPLLFRPSFRTAGPRLSPSSLLNSPPIGWIISQRPLVWNQPDSRRRGFFARLRPPKATFFRAASGPT